MYNIGVLVIATDKYSTFVPPLYASMKKYFMTKTKAEVTMFVFTDKDVQGGTNMVILPQKHAPWPSMTLKRYHIFSQNSSTLFTQDFLFYIDADSLFVDYVDDEILGDLVATQHAGYFESERKDFTYDKNPVSTAYVSDEEGTAYYCGGFNGGKTKNFLQMAADMVTAIDINLKNDVVAEWHDESHLNRYLIDNPPTKVLHPAYCAHEGRFANYTPKILALLKTNWGRV